MLLAQRRADMVDRRGATRFLLTDQGVGSLRLIQDVVITGFDHEQATVEPSVAIPRGERLLLEFAESGGGLVSVLVLAIRARAVVNDGRLSRQVLLQFVRRKGEVGPTTDLDRRHWPVPPVVGALVRRVPVRLVDVSASGCLFDSPARVEDGTVGFLDVANHTQRHSEAVRTRRTSRTEGLVWPYRTAAQFLTLGPASPASLRGVATIMAVGRSGYEPASGHDRLGVQTK
jgi:hypothetical protein